MTNWCTFQDFLKYSDRRLDHEEKLTEAQKKVNWNTFLREKALETIFEVERYLARNKVKTVKGTG